MNKQAVNIIVFACNWNGLSCIEAAAQAGLDYPTSARVIRVSCLSRVHQGLILKAFELGAAGVMLLGCEPESCQFNTDATHITREYQKAKMILRMLGLGEKRLMLCHTRSGDGSGFVRQVTGFIKELEQMRTPEAAGV
jgi:coenzyme F420-reducing hydrogenase delta subunit